MRDVVFIYPPTGGTSAAQRLPLACRVFSPTKGAQSQRPYSVFWVRSIRRDDRGMMTPGCAGRRELLFTSFPAQPKSAPASARRTPAFSDNVIRSRWLVAEPSPLAAGVLPGCGGKAVKQGGFVEGTGKIFGDDFVTERLMCGRRVE